MPPLVLVKGGRHDGRLGRVAEEKARGRKVLFEGGEAAWLLHNRLTELPDEREGPPPPDPLEAAAFYWPHLWQPGDSPRVLPAVTAAQLRGEVTALRAAYADVSVEWGEYRLVLCWTTPRVVLEGINLGRFRVTLGVTLDPDVVDYDELLVDALEPNPSAHNDKLTHPHVLAGSVCLGNGHFAFLWAVQTGRLADAADVLWSVLRTWSDGHFEGGDMNEWDGYSCGNCGAVNDDRPSRCRVCRDDLCGNCMASRCDECEEDVHDGCMSDCECGRTLCERCVCNCEEEAEESSCPQCRSEPEGPPEYDLKCPACYRAWLFNPA